MSTHAATNSHKALRWTGRNGGGGGGGATSLAPIQVIRTVFRNVSGRVYDVPTEKTEKRNWNWGATCGPEIQHSHARVCTDENERFD